MSATFSALIKLLKGRKAHQMELSNVCWQFRFFSTIICCVGFGICLIAFYPGLLSPNSLDQYQQARTFTFDDFHAPELAFIWSLLNFAIPGPHGIFILLLALYWAAIFVLASAAAVIDRRVAFAMPLLGFMPFAINFAGTIWTDVLVATSWLMSVALVFSTEVRLHKMSTARRIAAWALFLCGSLARPNTLFAAVPIGLYLIKPGSGFNFWPRIGFTLTLLAGLLLGNQLFNVLLNVKKTYPIHSIVTFDLGGISNFSSANYFPMNWSKEEQKRLLSECYEARQWDTYRWGDCSFVYEELIANNLWGSTTLWRAWLYAVVTQPLSYLRHRLAYFRSFLAPELRFFFVDKPQERMPDRALFRAIRSYLYRADRVGVFLPIHWLVLAVGCLLLSCLVSPVYRRFVEVVCLSSIIYLVTYLFVGVASDFRYAYWSVLATSAATIVVGCDLLATRTGRKDL